MTTINIYGENRHEHHTKLRVACRGIILRDDMVLMTHAREVDFWMLPGGGLEGNEDLSQCCIRELAEETGLIVKPLYSFATINEFYEEWLYRSHYFVCAVVGETQRHLTAAEAENDLVTRWIPLRDAVAIFSAHEDHRDEEMKRGAYLREYRALEAFLREGNV